jgi:hypothetical protein
VSFLVIVTFVIANWPVVLTGNVMRGDINASGIAAISAAPQPTDTINLVTFTVASMAEAKKRVAETLPPTTSYVGWKHGPVLVVELPSGKITRLEVKPRFKTVTKQTTEQDGYEAVEQQP